MVDSTKKPGASFPDLAQSNLINKINELEAILTQKKAVTQAETQTQQTMLPRLNVGTDGIPVLVEVVTEKDLFLDVNLTPDTLKKDSQFINDIIDKEITKDLDELIPILKDRIIDKVKTRLLKELHINEDGNKKKE